MENGIWRVAVHWKWWEIDAAFYSKGTTRAVDDSGRYGKSTRIDGLQTHNAAGSLFAVNDRCSLTHGRRLCVHRAGECPSLMPLPPLTPGTSAKPGSKLPTHLYKRGRMGGPTKLQDHFQIGDWVEGKPGEVAVWKPTPNIPFQARGGGVLVDEGLYYGK